MIIRCTKKIIDAAKKNDIQPPAPDDGAQVSELLHTWHANVVTVDRRKILFFVNDLTGICVIYYSPKPADYRDMQKILREGVSELLRFRGFREEVIERYLADDEQMLLTKTGNRSLIARMNEVGRAVGFYSEDFSEDRGLQLEAMASMFRNILKFDGKYETVGERLERAMAKAYGDGSDESVVERNSYVLKIRLDLEKYDIYRLVEVPERFTFHELHRLISVVFGWFDYHCHEFDVIDASLDQSIPIYALPTKMTIYDGNDPFALDFAQEGRRYERDTSMQLKDVFETEDWCLYRYDLGDNWEHIITVEERRKGSGQKHPVLLELKGERPPEDVGGEGGFEEYMAIISDPDHPEYEEMLEWAKITRATERTREDINMLLKAIFS